MEQGKIFETVERMIEGASGKVGPLTQKAIDKNDPWETIVEFAREEGHDEFADKLEKAIAIWAELESQS